METIRFNEVRKTGIMSNLDKRRTIMENIKRNALTGGAPLRGHPQRRPALQDLAPRVPPRDQRRGDRHARRLRLHGEFEKYITRSFYFWMVRFLRTKYNNVKIVFITHHTEAKEVDEQAFFELASPAGRASPPPTSWPSS